MDVQMGDEEERRLYWKQQMDAAYEFMLAIREYPVAESEETLASIPKAVRAAGVKVLFSPLPHVRGLERLFLLRTGLMPAFLAAAEEMNGRGWVLKIEDAYRTREMQKYNALRHEIFPAVLAKVRWELGGGEPSIDQFRRRLAALIAMSPRVGTHCCGSAIDVSVLALDESAEIDRGALYLEVSEKTPMGSPFISDQAAEQRAEITAIMARHGFRTYPYEFWHYSKGDAYDEYLTQSGRPARYGAVDFDTAAGTVTPIADAAAPLNSDEEIAALIGSAMQQDRLTREQAPQAENNDGRLIRLNGTAQKGSILDIGQLTALYLQRREQREKKIARFWAGEVNSLVIQRPSYHLWGECNSVEGVYNNNLRHMESWLSMPWSDELPHMQPWFGTGVYANAFGCEYLWRQGEAPDTHLRYHSIEEVRGLAMPDWRKSPVMGMVLECIDVLKERTRGRFPIALTDTQSPCDTATLVLDTSEFFTACYTEEETVAELMGTIARLIIEFSREQARRIGEGLVSRPGHVMPSLPSLGGITLSDDNLSVSSPLVNEKFSLRFNQLIAKEMGGVALHSCGVWDHTMKLLPGRGVAAVDCSVSPRWDPTPMTPAMVRAALGGTGIVVKARCGGTREEIEQAVAALAGPDMRLILDIARIDEDDAAYARAAEANYELARESLERASRT